MAAGVALVLAGAPTLRSVGHLGRTRTIMVTSCSALRRSSQPSPSRSALTDWPDSPRPSGQRPDLGSSSDNPQSVVRYSTVRPDRSRATSPLASNTPRCCDTALAVTPSARARSVVVAGERSASSRVARTRPSSLTALPAGGRCPQRADPARRVAHGGLRRGVPLHQHLPRTQYHRHQHQTSRPQVDHPIPVAVVDRQPTGLPVQVRMHVRKQSLRAAGGQLPCAVTDVGIKHSPDTRPVRRDQQVVGSPQLGGVRP